MHYISDVKFSYPYGPSLSFVCHFNLFEWLSDLIEKENFLQQLRTCIWLFVCAMLVLLEIGSFRDHDLKKKGKKRLCYTQVCITTFTTIHIHSHGNEHINLSVWTCIND